MKIYLSPSLQEKNIGVEGYGTEEKRMNELADYVQQFLVNYGYEIFRNIPSMTLEEVVAESNRVKPNLHLALHSNAFNGKARGCEIFCYSKESKGYKIAQEVYKYLEPLTPTADRGIKTNTLYETYTTTAPAILIEIAFHDNKDDALFIMNNMKAIALSIVNGINDYFGVDNVPNDYKQKYENLLKDIKALIKIYEGR